MYVATIEIESDDDYALVSAPDGRFGDEGIELDVSPTGVYSTAFTLRTISGAFEIGGRAVGHEIPIRDMTLPFNLYAIPGQTIEETISRFRRMWRMGATVKWSFTTEISGTRWLNLRLAKEIGFSPERDWNIDGFVRAVVTAVALQPMYESEEESDSWSNPSAGSHTGAVKLSNPTDQKCFLEWSLDPATSWGFPDFSFGQEKHWKRPPDADAARMINTPLLTQRLSVMADPMMDTYISADLSNASGLFNGVEPIYWIPPYTDELYVPVTCNGPADATCTVTMRRFWSAEAGL